MDDPANALRATINQIPESMEASRGVMNAYLAFRGGQDIRQDPKKRAQDLEGLLSTVVAAVVHLESRIDISEGGTGMPVGRIAAMLTEFRFGP